MSDNLFKEDVHAWMLEAVNKISTVKIQEGAFDDKFVVELIEFIGELAGREEREVVSCLRNMLLHLLKWKYQPSKQTKSWALSLANRKHDLEIALSTSLVNSTKETYGKAYAIARKEARAQTGLPIDTFPETPEWSYEDIIKWDRKTKSLDWGFVDNIIAQNATEKGEQWLDIATEIKDWVTIKGAKVPVGQGGKLLGKVGKDIADNEK